MLYISERSVLIFLKKQKLMHECRPVCSKYLVTQELVLSRQGPEVKPEVVPTKFVVVSLD